MRHRIARHGLARIGAMLAAAVLGMAGPAGAQTVERLYPGGAPGSEDWKLPEAVRRTPDGGSIFTNVRDPEIITYPADPARANGTAVILLPGGGLRLLGVAGDASEAIQRMTSSGIAVFVLKYRILQVPPAAGGARPAGGPPPLPNVVIRNGNANPAPDDATLTKVLDLATADAQETILRIRANAAKLHIDANRIGMMGFSAGGGVAMGVVIKNRAGTMPNFVVSLYGPSLQDVRVAGNAPPLFLATESNHGAVTEGLAALFSIWKAAGKSAEFHSFEIEGGLKFNLWADRFFAWLGSNGMMPAR